MYHGLRVSPGTPHTCSRLEVSGLIAAKAILGLGMTLQRGDQGSVCMGVCPCVCATGQARAKRAQIKPSGENKPAVLGRTFTVERIPIVVNPALSSLKQMKIQGGTLLHGEKQDTNQNTQEVTWEEPRGRTFPRKDTVLSLHDATLHYLA